jgi:hypothetical protein
VVLASSHLLLVNNGAVIGGAREFTSAANKTDRHDIAEILLKVALNTIHVALTITSLNVYVI